MLPNILVCAVFAGLMVLICAWPQGTFLGVLIAAITTSVLVGLIGSFYGTQFSAQRVGGIFASLTVLLLPLIGLFGAVFTLLRWLVNKQVEYHADHASLLRRLVVPGLLLCLVAGISASALYPPEGRQRIQEMNALVQAGIQAPDAAGVPPAFAKFADSFKQRATSDYALQWLKSDLIEWRIGRPAEFQEWQLSIAVARFENGWMVACLFAPDERPPNCQAYDRDPTLPTDTL
jgi:hypothetical protein